MIEYEIVYSSRRSIGISVKAGGKIVVRAPFFTKQSAIEKVIQSHKKWIENHVLRELEREKTNKKLTTDEISLLRKEAKEYFFRNVPDFAKKMGLSYQKITITGAKTRFGSCSSKKTLAFSYYLMNYPIEAREYVIVHELSHLVYMNHSKEFYRLIETYMPDYKERIQLLKK